MNPVVVIGTGGSGKWVATDLKLAAVDMRNRELLREHGESARQRPDWDTLPPEIQILTVDVSKADHHPVIRHDAFRSEFSLDYTEASNEFVDISASLGTVIKEISEGQSTGFPRISAWLSKSDASCYDVHRLPPSTGSGAGQLRQLGRASLFVALLDKHTLPDRIDNAIQRAAAARTDNSKITIFVCGSLAGGTGSGIMWDIAALARHYAESVVPGRYDIVGFVVLPGAFRRIASSARVERVRMAANTYAGLRELTRLMDSHTRTTFGYYVDLEMRLDHPIFNVAYLVEGSRPSGYDLAGEQPQFGTYPSIADAILLHAATTVDLTNMRTEMNRQPEGVFSTTGAVQWILPIEEIIYEFGHSLAKLSLESLLWAQQATETVPPPEAQQRADDAATPRREEFFTSTGSGSFPLVRFVNAFLEQLRMPPLSTGMMMQQVRFKDNRDRDLPELALADLVELAPRMSKGDPAGVKQQVEDLVARMTGGVTDELESGHITVHAVLNHYQMLHEQAFRDYLDVKTIDVLNSTASGAGKSVRPGGLLHTEAFLKSVHDRLEQFRRRLTEVYQEEQLINGSGGTRLQRAEQELTVAEGAMLAEKGIRDRIGRRIRQAEYLKRAQTVYDLTIQELVHSRILDIVEAWLAIVGRQRADVQGWDATFRKNIETLGAEVRGIQSRRLENIRIRSRRYVSEPGDNFETDLFNSCLNVSDPQDVIGSAGVASLLQKLSWTWSDGELILLVPSGSAHASDRLMWQQDGLPQHKYRCFETFAGLRRTTIWDAFQRLGYDESRLRAELLGLMEPITNVDDVEQQRYPRVELVSKDIVLAAWEEAQQDDAPKSARRLSQRLRTNLGNAAVWWNDPHLVLAVSQRHLVKLGALSCVPALKPNYDRILTGKQPVEGTERRLPLHLFPGESLAAELELRSAEIFDEAIVIPPKFVDLLEHEDEMLNFVLAIAFEHIKPTVDRKTGESSWTVVAIPLNGMPGQEVSLGAEVYEACATFLRPQSPSHRNAKQCVNTAVTHNIKSFSTNHEYAQHLRNIVNTGLISPQDLSRDSSNESLDLEFDKLARVLIWRRANKLS